MTEQKVVRRLAAILAADVVGYSRMMGEDETATVRAIKLRLDEILPAIRQFGGEIINIAGDGVLAEFPSVVDAVTCAMHVQVLMEARNEGVPENRCMRLRMGINVGDVIHEGTQRYGDGINVAARLESIAEPGGLCISSKVYEEIVDKLSHGYRDLGERTLKNIARPVRVYAVDRDGARPGQAPVAPSPATKPTPSIAVLPFADLSADRNQEYFADGLAEDLLRLLSRIPGLRVASRTSAFTFRGACVDVPTAARKLGVAAVLEGSVRKSGNRVRITAQLIDAATDSHLWSQTYDRDLQDVFAVQDDIAQSVVAELRSALLGEAPAAARVQAEVKAAVTSRIENVEAFRRYLQGRHFEERLDREGIAGAIELYREAIEIDPSYAMAWAALARSCVAQGAHSLGADVADSVRDGRAAAARALEIEPDLPDALVVMGTIHMIHDWDWSAAEDALRRALEGEPTSVRALQGSAKLAACLGRFEEAKGLIRRAVDLDPLNASLRRSLALAYLRLDQLDKAEAAAKSAVELNPAAGFGNGNLGMVLLARGRSAEALEHVNRESLTTWRLTCLAQVNHALGRAAESDAALGELVRIDSENGAYQIAECHAYRGEADVAFEWLERGYAQRDGGLASIKASRSLRPVHSDPRWPRFLQKLGLEP